MTDTRERLYTWEKGDIEVLTTKGGKGSGFFGHAGIPGHHGGSRSGGTSASLESKYNLIVPKNPTDAEDIAMLLWRDKVDKNDWDLGNIPVVVNENQIPPVPEGMVRLYHGTTSRQLKSILNNGLLTGAEAYNLDPEAHRGEDALDFIMGYTSKFSPIGDINIVVDVPSKRLRKVNEEWAEATTSFKPRDIVAIAATENAFSMPEHIGLFKQWIEEKHLKSFEKEFKRALKERVSIKGGAGSGFFGHAGRPGKQGGSASSGDILPGNSDLEDAEYKKIYKWIRVATSDDQGNEPSKEILNKLAKFTHELVKIGVPNLFNVADIVVVPDERYAGFASKVYSELVSLGLKKDNNSLEAMQRSSGYAGKYQMVLRESTLTNPWMSGLEDRMLFYHEYAHLVYGNSSNQAAWENGYKNKYFDRYTAYSKTNHLEGFAETACAAWYSMNRQGIPNILEDSVEFTAIKKVMEGARR